MNRLYEQWSGFLMEQISYQEWKARDENLSPEATVRCEERAKGFKALLKDLAEHKCPVVVQEVTKVETIDELILKALRDSPTKIVKKQDLERLLKDRATKAVINLRISEVVKYGKAWRMGDKIGLPREDV